MGNTQGQQDQLADMNSQQHIDGDQAGANAEGNQVEYQYTEQDLEYVGQKEEDEAYGEIKIYRIKRELEQDVDNPQEDLEICTKTKIFDSREDCRDYYEDLKSKKYLNHPHLVRLVRSQAILNSNFCTNIYKIDMAYEYHKLSLKEVLLSRFETKEFFDENSIFDLIEQVMSVLYYFKINGLVHGDIQPRTILIDNNNNFKLTDIIFLTAGMCGYKKHLLNLETECFLAPELLQKLRRSTILDNEEVDQEKADIFSLGLVALAMGTLQNVDIIYDFENYTIKEEEILALLETIKSQYSYNLYLLLVSMLNQIDKRINLEDGLNLIDQMRNGNFNLEEYETKRFQSELEQSEKKLAESVQPGNQYIQSLDQQYRNSHDRVIQQEHDEVNSKDEANYNGQARNQPGNEISNTEQSEDRIPDFDPDREARKRSRINRGDNQPSNNNNSNNNVTSSNFNSSNQNSQQNANRNQPQNANMNESSHSYHNNSYNEQQQQPLNRGNTYNSDQKKNPTRSTNQFGQGQSQQNIQQSHQSDHKNDRYDSNQFNQNSHQKNINSSQQYQNMSHQHPNPNHNNSTSINDIENRFREAILRSQQVSLKFENSPLRLFRDQLLADELYVPLDPQFSNASLIKSRNLENSGRKNQLSQSNKLNYSNNVSQNFSAQKNTKKNDSTQKLIQKKWKI
ncbi:hypothetical protein ABPG72_019781 [Tetrahymena utriculariae]